jgi:RNA polymerase sigma-B factor
LPAGPTQLHARSDEWLVTRYRAESDEAARDELVRRLMPVARRIAGMYPSREHGEDLVQVAAYGLIKAIDRFDPSFGTTLKAFAVPTMLGEVRRYLRDHSWSVRLPRQLQERVLRVTKSIEALTPELGRSPTPAEIAADLGVSEEEVVEAMVASSAYSAASLETPLGGEDGDRRLADTVGYSDERFEIAEDVSVLRELRTLLSPRDRLIFYQRFVQDFTQAEIARNVGISQMQVSRILRRTLALLRERAAATGPADPEPAGRRRAA